MAVNIKPDEKQKGNGMELRRRKSTNEKLWGSLPEPEFEFVIEDEDIPEYVKELPNVLDFIVADTLAGASTGVDPGDSYGSVPAGGFGFPREPVGDEFVEEYDDVAEGGWRYFPSRSSVESEEEMAIDARRHAVSAEESEFPVSQ